MSDKRVGLKRKYRVYKYRPCDVEANPCGMEHLTEVRQQVFVLNPESDPIAKVAIKAYAEQAAADGYEALAEDLFNWLAEL